MHPKYDDIVNKPSIKKCKICSVNRDDHKLAYFILRGPIEKKCDAYVMKWHFYYEKLDYVQKKKVS